MRKLMAAFALAGLVAGCSEQATAPDRQQGPAIAADFSNNPTGGGPVVAWYGPYDFFVEWDNNHPGGTVRAYHTTFPLSEAFADVGPWDDQVCGPADRTPGFRLQEVAHWDHSDPSSVWLQNGVADVWIVLVDLTSSGPCAGYPIIASGSGTLRYTDDNATSAWGGHAPGVQDTWTWRAEGRLTVAATGKVVQYNGFLHCTVPLPSDGWCNDVINF